VVRQIRSQEGMTWEALPAREPLVLTEQAMPAAALRRVAGGTVAFATVPAPARQGPNEDALAVVPLDAESMVVAIADGVGGAPLGAAAARLAVEAVARSVLDLGPGAAVRDGVLDGFERANRAVLDLGVGAATTLVVVEVTPGALRCYHAGDSGVLVTGQRGRLKLLTMAHSPVGYGIEAGLLDAREAMSHDQRNVVSNLVGAPDMRVELGSPIVLGRHDTVVIGTDGLFDNLHLEEIVGSVRIGALDCAAQALYEECRTRMTTPSNGHPSKPDDLTFLLFRQQGSPR
jgi:PPM family protein phosphatase